MSWKIVLDNHQCVYLKRSSPHCWAHCHNNDNPRRGDCVEEYCPKSLSAFQQPHPADRKNGGWSER